jgi:hypothetical protein
VAELTLALLLAKVCTAEIGLGVHSEPAEQRECRLIWFVLNKHARTTEDLETLLLSRPVFQCSRQSCDTKFFQIVRSFNHFSVVNAVPQQNKPWPWLRSDLLWRRRIGEALLWLDQRLKRHLDIPKLCRKATRFGRRLPDHAKRTSCGATVLTFWTVR